MNLYRCLLRPASSFTLPSGLVWAFHEAPWDRPQLMQPRAANRHGVIQTDRPLTREECEHFDLEPV